jgi:hypothetical protein
MESFMTGQAHWLTLVLLLGFAAFFGLLALGSYLSLKRYREVRKGVSCPVHRVNAEARLVFDDKTQQWVGMYGCTALPRNQATCDLACIKGRAGPEQVASH